MREASRLNLIYAYATVRARKILGKSHLFAIHNINYCIALCQFKYIFK